MTKYLFFHTNTHNLSTKKRQTTYPRRQGKITDTEFSPCSAIPPSYAAFPEHRKSSDMETEHIRSILQTSTSIIYYTPSQEHYLSLPLFSPPTFPPVARWSEPASSPPWPASINDVRRSTRSDEANPDLIGQ